MSDQRNILDSTSVAHGRHSLRAGQAAHEAYDFHGSCLSSAYSGGGEYCITGPDPVYHLGDQRR